MINYKEILRTSGIIIPTASSVTCSQIEGYEHVEIPDGYKELEPNERIPKGCFSTHLYWSQYDKQWRPLSEAYGNDRYLTEWGAVVKRLW